MTIDEINRVLDSAFAALADDQKANLRHAAANDRLVCCGDDCALFTDQSGAG